MRGQDLANLPPLHADWQVQGARLLRRFDCRNFSRALQLANLAGWLGEALGHHPDLALGWGWCEVAFTSHEAGGLTPQDYAMAARLDRVLAQAQAEAGASPGSP